MRIYTRDRSPDLRHGLLTHLLDAFDAPPGDLLLISPWLRDVDLPVADAGHFSTVFGGHRERVALSELLGRLVARHRVVVVVKPPAELIPLDRLRRLVQVLAARAALLAEVRIRDFDVTERTAVTFGTEAEGLEQEFTKHAATLHMVSALRATGAEIRFLDNLHAKFLWSRAGAMLGSANFTNAGFGRNEELMVEITTREEHERLGATALEFVGRATAAAAYDLGAGLRSAGIQPAQFHEWPSVLEVGGRAQAASLTRELQTFLP
ncbi:MAG: hypothetical protein AVDCRST_MAG68-5677 [uncultured Gemmatimonadetes bacterium]|uniref:Phospholipase D-like domain-containing protein n=1 Tax=uncultured Gemmatimonadota bacterium TaxID=203437 RepID=A0A6J4MXG5_9BACT|nr:MAG: hypothetical protein AVDCRST_MAG68-5677 [uncultured Gemmatimonadota bacterium]